MVKRDTKKLKDKEVKCGRGFDLFKRCQRGKRGTRGKRAWERERDHYFASFTSDSFTSFAFFN